MRIFNLLYLLLLLVALVASVSSVRPGKQPATFGRTHLHPLAGRFSQPEEKISQTPLPTQTLPAPPLQSTLPLRLKHKNEEEKHEYDTVDGSQHRDLDVKWKTMGHREKDCCIWVCPVGSTFPLCPEKSVNVYCRRRRRDEELHHPSSSMFDIQLKSYGPKSCKHLSDCSYDEQHPHSTPTKCL
ncbi:hypothetical protein D9C73_002460 [Collichthys lucidus]|uniref:Secreted protein n=1 Tax=Collichthys lucidus TaxID=240159 RepID=A0A4U5U3T5_COLLU|nr:hypothetical protein D9C73_002460 [Collichthys lucidus]